MTVSMDLTTLRQDLLAPAMATFLLVLMCYIAGRIHQFFKQTIEREQAFRDGYNIATKALFGLATRVASGPVAKRPPEPTKPMVGYASVPGGERHPLPAKHRATGRRKRGLADTKRITTP